MSSAPFMMCVCLDGANWLTFFCQPVKSWNGLILRKPIDMEKRELIQRQEATLLDLRSYLFSRQCTLLLFLQRPWEVAQRALELLHGCVQELKLLEVSPLFPVSPLPHCSNTGLRAPTPGIEPLVPDGRVSFFSERS